MSNLDGLRYKENSASGFLIQSNDYNHINKLLFWYVEFKDPPFDRLVSQGSLYSDPDNMMKHAFPTLYLLTKDPDELLFQVKEMTKKQKETLAQEEAEEKEKEKLRELERIESEKEIYKEFGKVWGKAILENKVTLGMSYDAVIASLGTPKNSYKVIQKGIKVEQLSYPDIEVILKNGFVWSIQEHSGD